MRHRYLAILALLPLAGCGGAIPGLGGGPARPAVAIADEVGDIDTSAVLGTWTCRELNPYPDQPLVEQTMTFVPGRLTSEAILPMAEGGGVPGVGDMRMVWTGDWRAEGGALVTKRVDVEVTNPDGTPLQGLSAMVASVAQGFARDGALGGTVEVLRLDAREMVLRGGGEDAPTLGCRRG